MPITLEPISLDSAVGDNEGRLAKRDGRLFAVLSQLGALHDELRGHWFVEAVFGEEPLTAGQTFRSLDAFERFVTA